jgi:hypothetical protein
VRVAEDDRPRPRLESALDPIEVELAPAGERNLDEPPPRLGDEAEERVIDGRGDDDTVLRLGEHPKEVAQPGDDVVARDHRIGVDLPRHPAPEETGQRGSEPAGVRVGVPRVALGHGAGEGGADRGGEVEIGLGDERRQDVGLVHRPLDAAA